MYIYIYMSIEYKLEDYDSVTYLRTLTKLNTNSKHSHGTLLGVHVQGNRIHEAPGQGK